MSEYLRVSAAVPSFVPDPPNEEVYRSKSCVACGGRNAEMDFKGAPHKPGIILSVKESTIMESIILGRLMLCMGLSPGKRSFPTKYKPKYPKIMIQSARKIRTKKRLQRKECGST